MGEESKIIKPQQSEPAEYTLSLEPNDGKPRLKLDMPADKMFIEVTETDPPYMVVVCRADMEVQALGLLEKAKWAVLNFQAMRAGLRANLTKGVRSMARNILGR